MPTDWQNISNRLLDIQTSHMNFEEAIIALGDRNSRRVEDWKSRLLAIREAIQKKAEDPEADTIDPGTGLDLSKLGAFLISSSDPGMTDEEMVARQAWDGTSEVRWLHSDFIPQISRAIHFLACYIALENYLLVKCELLAKGHFQGENAFAAIKDSGVLKAKNFLKSVLGIKTFNSGVGGEMDQFRLIRNSISHNGVSRCFIVQERQVNWVKNHPHLEWYDKKAREVEFTDRFVPYVIETINSFVKLLEEEMFQKGYVEEPDLSFLKIEQVQEVDDREITEFEMFWAKFLRKLPEKTKLHASSKVSKSNNLAQNAGYPHIDYRYLPRKQSTAVALFIDLGEKEKNQAILHRLVKHKDAIETVFGGPLHWDPYPKSRNVKVQKRVTLTGIDDEAHWDQIMDQMIDAMIRLEKAFRPYIESLNAVES